MQSCPELSGGEAFFVTALVACSTGGACTMMGSFLVPSSGAGVKSSDSPIFSRLRVQTRSQKNLKGRLTRQLVCLGAEVIL